MLHFLANILLENKIVSQYHYKPIFLFKKIFNKKFYKKDFQGAMSYYKNTVSLPIFPLQWGLGSRL